MKKILAWILLAVLIVGTIGCAGNDGGGNSQGGGTPTNSTAPANSTAPSNTSTEPTDTSTPAEPSTSEQTGAIIYPLEGGPYKLSIFAQFHKKLNGYYNSYEDLDVIQWWKEAVGVEIEWNTPAASAVKDQLNIMLASNEYSDIINYTFDREPGGTVGLYADGVIIRLDEHNVEENAPAMMAFLSETPAFLQAAKDDEGHLYYFPLTKQGTVQLSSTGPLLRGDMLKEIGIDKLPSTIPEWDTILRAVKEKYPDVIPHIATWSKLKDAFQPAYDIGSGDWYVDREGVVHYSYTTDGYKAFLQQMNTWYNDGLIDANLAQNTDSDVDIAMSARTAFSCLASGGNGIGAYMDANSDDPTFTIEGCQYPSIDGERVRYIAGWPFERQIVITTQCKNPEIAMRVLDYAYTEEGDTLLNWGKEGISYEVVNGEKKFYDFVIHDPNGKSVDASMSMYSIRAIKGPMAYISNEAVFLANYEKQEQKAACQRWADTTDWDYRAYPPVSYTEDEATEFASIMSDIETYADSMAMKFVLGTESFDNWATYVQTIQNFNIEGALKIQQDACDRFNAR